MARGPNWRRLVFSPEEIRQEHKWTPPPPKPKPVEVKVKREDDALNPLTTWMP